MKINSHNSPYFKKILVADCNVLNNGAQEPCKIYALERKEDRDYFKNLEHEREWENGDYLSHADYLLLNSREDVFALETNDGKCLGYCCADFEDEKKSSLSILETVNLATNKYYSRSNYKYLGETLLAFITKLTSKDKGKKEFQIISPDDTALGFYVRKCGFTAAEARPHKELTLYREDFKSLISQNKKHTGKKIELHI